MNILENAKENYDGNGKLYKVMNNLKKELTETYTALKYCRSCSQPFNVLDLGCGSGEVSRAVLEKGADFVVGIDLSSTMIESAEIILQSFEKSRYQLLVGNCFDSDLLVSSCPELKFDYIIANWLINYAESPEALKAFFVTCKKLLKPMGRIFGIYPNDSLIDHTEESHGKMALVSVNYEILGREQDFAPAKVKLLNSSTGETFMELLCNVFRKDFIRKTLEESGFEVEHIGPVDPSPEIEAHGFRLEEFRAYTDEIGVVSCFLAVSSP